MPQVVYPSCRRPLLLLTCTMKRMRLSSAGFSVSRFMRSKYTFMRERNSSLVVESSLLPTVLSSLQRHSISSARGRASS